MQWLLLSFLCSGGAARVGKAFLSVCSAHTLVEGALEEGRKREKRERNGPRLRGGADLLFLLCALAPSCSIRTAAASVARVPEAQHVRPPPRHDVGRTKAIARGTRVRPPADAKGANVGMRAVARFPRQNGKKGRVAAASRERGGRGANLALSSFGAASAAATATAVGEKEREGADEAGEMPAHSGPLLLFHAHETRRMLMRRQGAPVYFLCLRLPQMASRWRRLQEKERERESDVCPSALSLFSLLSLLLSPRVSAAGS